MDFLKRTNYSAILLFGMMLLCLSSCSKENILEEEVEVEEFVPEIQEDNLLLILSLDGQEIININTSTVLATDCMFGRVEGGSGNYIYTIGNSNDFQLLWIVETGDVGVHTFIAEPGLAGTTSFTLIDPCTNEVGENVNLKDYKITLEEIGEVGEVMSGTFEGKIAIDSNDYADMTGAFSVPRIDN